MNAHEKTVGESAADPVATHAPATGGGCCGAPAAAQKVQVEVVAAAPCCGTSDQAAAEGACCGTSAKVEAVAVGAGCCA